MNDNIFVCGYPGDVGGANTELWHTVKLWRRFGLRVTLIPTWQADAKWHERLDRIGCRTVRADPEDLSKVEGLAGGIVVSMCNSRFLTVAGRFRRLGCRIVWVNCMNWLFPAERLHYREQGPFDRYVFQSRYQRDQLVPQLRKFGFDESQGRIVRGAFATDEFPFEPLSHHPGEIFVVGRISRAATDKFSPRTWNIYEKIPHPIRARVLGWSTPVRRSLGSPPDWAECLPQGGECPRAFLGSLHALVHAGGEARENWPRVGLEAMAAGVPVVADNRGGWREMIRHGRTGYLCENDEQFAYYTARLAYDPAHRLQIVEQARATLETELADPETIWKDWKQLFEEIS